MTDVTEMCEEFSHLYENSKDTESSTACETVAEDGIMEGMTGVESSYTMTTPETQAEIEKEQALSRTEDIYEKGYSAVCHLRSPSMIQVNVNLEGKELKADVDTGAQVSIISDQIFKELKLSGPVIKAAVLQLAGRQLKIESSVVGPKNITLRENIYEEEVYIAPTEHEMLLGLNFFFYEKSYRYYPDREQRLSQS